MRYSEIKQNKTKQNMKNVAYYLHAIFYNFQYQEKKLHYKCPQLVILFVAINAKENDLEITHCFISMQKYNEYRTAFSGARSLTCYFCRISRFNSILKGGLSYYTLPHQACPAPSNGGS